MRVREIVGTVAGSKWLRLAGAACVVAIAILSLVPRNWHGINNAATHGPLQHLVAYFGTALAIGLGIRERRNPAILMTALVAYAGLMEILQNYSPGRNPAMEGFVWSSLGAVAGAFLAFAIREG